MRQCRSVKVTQQAPMTSKDKPDNTLNANHSYLLCIAQSRRKKTHCVAAVGFLSFKSQLTDVSFELEGVSHTDVETGRRLVGHASCATQSCV
jgi:hypothetical protein